MTTGVAAARSVFVSGLGSPLGRLVRRHLKGWAIRRRIGGEGADAVVHLSYDYSPVGTETTFRRNVLEPLERISAGVENGPRTVVIVSSIMTYGARP
jgi:nucleoside-diphosphate-sugar epimerase